MKNFSKKIKHKFGAVAVKEDGHHFSSKLEHAYYKQLLMRQKCGDIEFFLRQVPIHLPGGVKMVVDYMEFTKEGEVRFVEVKGKETLLYLTKKKMVEAMYPFKIEVVKRV